MRLGRLLLHVVPTQGLEEAQACVRREGQRGRLDGGESRHGGGGAEEETQVEEEEGGQEEVRIKF